MKPNFQLVSDHSPAGDQPNAIKQLVERIEAKNKSSVLLGATGTGKTFTIANVIAQVRKRTLVLAHNKTLAGQLYNELKSLFPHNQVEYFISYFDYYQPEAYLPRTDTFIEKSSITNELIEMMRLSTLTSLTNHIDVIVVASVAAIYPSSPPSDFREFRITIKKNEPYGLKKLINELVRLNYRRNDIHLSPGCFRVKGDVVEVALGYQNDFTIRVSFDYEMVESIVSLNPLNNSIIRNYEMYLFTPADEYIMDNSRKLEALKNIEIELEDRLTYFSRENKIIEHERLKMRIEHDLESMRELGYCNGIENYARHLELRPPGSTPYTLFDYMGDDWLLVIDESHMTMPQIRGMYNTDLSRKQSLVEYGFRLPSAMDNRPLNFEEFLKKINQVVYVSATPNDWEINQANKELVEQIVRPTGLIDPEIIIQTSVNQIDDLIARIQEQVKIKERTLVTVLTIRMAEELTEYLKQQKIKVTYLHNELKTLERDKVLNDLRRGIYDVVVGINLLREGIDLPEVSLICIFDANKPGFFRSDKALIQTIGRAARNDHGRVVMYADSVSDAMKVAINETNRRRKIQTDYNVKYNITPKNIVKAISDDLQGNQSNVRLDILLQKSAQKKQRIQDTIKLLQDEMLAAANNQEYELAAHIRDLIIELQTNPKNIKNHTKIKK